MSARRRRGFTLLEVLVSIALLLALLTALFGFLSNLFETRDRAQAHLATQRAAQSLIDRLEADALTCLVTDAAAGAGIDGQATSLRMLSRSVTVTALATSVDPSRALGDLVVTTCSFDEATGELRMSRGEPGQTGDEITLGGSVFRVRFRYLDGTSWVETFNSDQAGYLPRAIEVMVWFNPWPGEEPVDAAEIEAEAIMPDRSTFDGDAGFDETAFAEASDLDVFDDPWPDRARIIVIPDAEAAPSDEGER